MNENSAESKPVFSADLLTKVEGERDQKRIKELESLRDSISQMIVNDLRDPLTVIQTGIQYVLDEFKENGGYCTDNMEKTLKNALVQCRRQMTLVNDLLDVSQVDLDPMELKKDKTHFVALAHACIDAVEPALQKQELNLLRNFPQFVPTAVVDANVMRRVIVNLLSNCIKFTKPGGKITFTINWPDVHQLECVIEDNGLAIPTEDLTRVFDRAFVGDPFGRFRKGQGFGLAYCRLAIEAHGGRIWAEKASPKGNRFLFTLPV